MTLVQIDLRRSPGRSASGPPAAGPAAQPHGTEAAEEDHTGAEAEPVPQDSLAPAAAGLALASGLILLAPLAPLAVTSRPALALLLAGLVVLGLLVALLRPALAGVEPR